MSDYSNILSRKTFKDKFSDGLNNQADSIGKPMNQGQADTQTVLRGFASGFSRDSEREAKIAELEEQYKQIDGLNRQLQKTAGENQLKEQKIKSFIMDQDSNLKLASDLITKGKYDQLDILAPSIFRAYNEHTGTNLGEFLFSKNGHISFRQPDGKIETMEAKTLFNPIMNYIPVENRGDYKGFATSYQAEELDAIVEARKLQKQTAESQIASNNANAELHRSQAEQIRQEAKNPPMTEEQKLILQTNIKSNRKYVEEILNPKLESSEGVLAVYDRLDNIVRDTPEIVGSNYITKFRRTISEAFGLDPNLDYAKLSSVEFEKQLRPILGAQLGEKEGERVLSKFPSIERNPKALKQFLKEERPKLIRSIAKMQATKNKYNENNTINILDDKKLGDLNSEYTNYINDRYSADKELLIDTNSKEYQLYKNKGGLVE